MEYEKIREQLITYRDDKVKHLAMLQHTVEMFSKPNVKLRISHSGHNTSEDVHPLITAHIPHHLKDLINTFEKDIERAQEVIDHIAEMIEQQETNHENNA